MTKSSTDSVIAEGNKKLGIKAKTTKSNKTEAIKKWLLKEVWNGRPVHWLAIGLAYVAVAYTAYSAAKYYIGIPEFNGIVAFVATLVIGSRAFKK